jgi:acyl-CoA reductase-like NAD-dependent aldehyde dehydrogenase
MYDSLGPFIDGEWRSRSGGGAIDVVDSATGAGVGTVLSAPRADVEEAIECGQLVEGGLRCRDLNARS